VTAARYDEIALLIETIRVTEPEVAARLRRMADLFDYDGLRDLWAKGRRNSVADDVSSSWTMPRRTCDS
jgi:hypothetical protein